ncbi:MAG: hypothetical protein V7637_6152 [Mycobacteriales bacterium]
MSAEPIEAGRSGAGAEPAGAGAVRVAEPGGLTLPARWPSAWPSLRPRLLRRAAFVAVVEMLTVAGLVAVADLATQWWALLPPLLLLIGPATAAPRARRRAERAAAAGRLTLTPDALIRPGRGRPIARLTPDGTIHYLR